MNAETSLEAMLPVVLRAVDSLLRRRGVRADFADDFRGWVMLKLLERQRRIAMQFRGESALSTYLRVVVERLYCDYLISRNGKWRSSQKARRLGAKAVSLEKLVYRDGYSLEQAVALLQPCDGKGDESNLRESFFELPARHPRVSVDCGKVLEQLPDRRPSGYELLRQKEIDQTSRVVTEALSDSLADLAEEDRLILELRFSGGLSISEISRRLNLKQRSVYNRFYRTLRVLRAKLAARNVHRGDLKDHLGESSGCQIEGVLAEPEARTSAIATPPVARDRERELLSA